MPTKTVDYYISKGFDRKAAEYFASGKKQRCSEQRLYPYNQPHVN